MAKDKKSFILYCDYISTFEELGDEEAGKLIKHIFRYVNDKDPKMDDRLLKILFEPIRQQFKRDLVKYEKRRTKNANNANKRWHKDDANGCDRMRPDANDADTDTVTVNDNVNVTVINRDKVMEFLRWAAPVSISPQALEEEAVKLMTFYQGQKIRNLRTICNKWMANYHEQPTMEAPQKKGNYDFI